MINPYELSSVILTVAVLIAYINHRYIGLQSTIAIMVGSMLLSCALLLIQHTGIANVVIRTEIILETINFKELLLHGMLSFLLFAGSMTINFNQLKSQRWEIGTLATVSTIASTLLVGTLSYYLLPFLGLHMPFLYCLLFGALISPTDPIAVLATFKEIGAPKNLEACVAGESLFNDGVAIVIFLTLYQLAFQGAAITFTNVTFLFIEETVGGILYGIILGYTANWLIKSCRDHKIAILITLVIVTGGYHFALVMDISGPLAMVIAGIFVGNKGRRGSKQNETRRILEVFWEAIDEVLNAILFFLIGFELLTLKASTVELIAIVAAIPLVLLIRLITVAIPMKMFQFSKRPYMISMLTWGGLRGGLAVALALTLPANEYRDFILAMTYGVVAFSVIVQGITIRPLAKAASMKVKSLPH